MASSSAADGTDGADGRDSPIRTGSVFATHYDAWRHAVAALARAGANVLVDEVMLAAAADQRRWEAALQGLDVCWVAIRCPADVAAAREQERGDRLVGLARSQAESVHAGVAYDLEIDTGSQTPEEAVAVLVGELTRRWDLAGPPASSGADDRPLLTAWPVPDQRPPPWES